MAIIYTILAYERRDKIAGNTSQEYFVCLSTHRVVQKAGFNFCDNFRKCRSALILISFSMLKQELCVCDTGPKA